MTMAFPKRVKYFDGQFLGVEDFEAEQAYHLAEARRHNIGPHSWGIAEGLTLSLKASPEDQSTVTLEVKAGFAVDGYGRTITVSYPRAMAIELPIYRRQGVSRLGVWLSYRCKAVPAALASGEGAEAGPDMRWDETPDIDTRPFGGADADPRRPIGVAASRHDFSPADPIAYTDGDAWPIYLGQILIDGGDNGETVANMANRPYVGLIGKEIRAPAGDAWVQLGGDHADDDRRFAVYIDRSFRDPDATAPADDGNVPETDPQAEDGTTPDAADIPVFEIAKDGRVTTNGPVALSRQLVMGGGALQFAGRVAASPRPPEAGWRIYRAKDPQTEADELRIEMPPPEGDAAPHEIAIGAWSDEQGRFRDSLTIGANGTVTVHGNLRVEGLINPPAQAGDTSPAAQAVRAAELAAIQSTMATKTAQANAAAAEAKQVSLTKALTNLFAKFFALFGIGGANRPGGGGA